MPDPDDEWGSEYPVEWDEYEEPEDHHNTPSLPIILISTASGISGGVIGLYVSFSMLHVSVEIGAALTTLALLFSLGISGATLSAVTGSRAAPTNIMFSCGLIVLVSLFLGLCALIGVIGATILLSR